MKAYKARNLKQHGFTVTMDVDGVGSIVVDFERIPKFFEALPHLKDPANFSKVKIDGGSLWFPPDEHLELEDIVAIAKEQSAPREPASASYKDKIAEKYDIKEPKKK